MDVNGSFEQPPKSVLNDDNQVQGTHLDDGHASSQYSNPSLLGGGSGSYRYNIPTDDAGVYNTYQHPGSPSLPQPDPAENPYPQQVYPGDILLDHIPYHAPHSEAGPFTPSLPEHGMEQEKAEHSWTDLYWDQPQQAPYFKAPSVSPTIYPGCGENDIIDDSMCNLQHQAVAPCALPNIASHGSTLGPQGTSYDTQQFDRNNYFEEGWNDPRTNLGQHQGNNALFASQDQRLEQEAPWSSMKKHHNHGRILMSEVNNLVRKIGSNEDGCAMNHESRRSDLVRSQSSTDTGHTANGPRSDQMGQPDLSWSQCSRGDQGSMPVSLRPAHPVLVQERSALHSPYTGAGQQGIPNAT